MRHVILFFSSILFSSFFAQPILFADEPQVKVPADFQFQGKPIQPACVFEIIDGGGVNLGTHPCQRYDAKNEENDRTSAESSFGYYLPDEGFPWCDFPESGYIFYKYVGKYPSQNQEDQNTHLLLCHYNTGGTGQFGSLEVVKLEGDRLQHVRTLDSGDRSEGRIIDGDIKDGILTYEKQIPFEYLHGLTPVEDSSKIFIPFPCLAGPWCSAVYSNGKLIKIEFEKTLLEDLPHKDVCYFQYLLEHTINNGKYSFTFDELTEFNKKAHAKCKDGDKELLKELDML